MTDAGFRPLQRRLLSPSGVNLFRGDSGSIFVVAMWSICLLATFAVMMSYGIRQKVALVRRFDDRDKLRLIAEAGMQKAICVLRSEETSTYDAFFDTWSSNTGDFQDIAVGDGTCNVCYNEILTGTGGSQLRWGMIDEARKISVNRADMHVLKRLLQAVLGWDEMQAQELAASIVDWRDADSGLSIPIGSAEDPYYRNTASAYEAKDADFETPEELLLVKGMTNEVFEKLKDYITVFTDGRVNINTASAEALIALGISARAADEFVAFRRGEDRTAGTADDAVFEAVSQIVPAMKRVCAFTEAETLQAEALAEQYFTTYSNVFSVRCIVGLNRKRDQGEVVSAIDRDGRILYWREF